MRALCLPALAAGFLFLIGCAGNSAEVSGTVLLDGEPIPEGSITFIPVEGTTGPGVGAVITNGQYHIPSNKGVTVGKNRVELRAFKNTGRKVQDPTGKRGTMTDERIPAFPPEYNDKSEIVRDIQKGANTVDFDVKTKEARK
jgi:hypothetical protein